MLRYSATILRDKALRRIARRLVDTAFRGSAEGLVTALFGRRRAFGRGVATDPGHARKGPSREKGEKQIMSVLVNFCPHDAVLWLAANVLCKSQW